MSDMHDDTPEQLPGAPEYRPPGFDLGAVVKWPFEDERWLPKVLVMGLLGLIPLVGVLNGLGWLKACYEARRADKLDLPDAGLGYLGSGFQLFLAFLPLFGVVLVLQGMGAVFSDTLLGGLFALVGGLAGMAVAALAPAVLYVHVKDGDLMASLRVDRLRAVVLGKDGVVPYLMLLAALLVSSVIGNLGGIVCLGIVLTLPLGWAMAGAALAEFERESAADNGA